ncbi:hypothetical protein CoNPh17_CDS0075 [Staphylococcus phage S-CoN_Ph17]|nr:hypothetical protein CoNPh17_CDS0075 [Staphylococcus phage S-CoN_Ph17]
MFIIIIFSFWLINFYYIYIISCIYMVSILFTLFYKI